MSRCFPFPPPGYEKEARPDADANLLLKEKHKEKKHKKDKKDKEKKERKEKKDKERSSEKHKDKKDRKHKRKDKNKNRDKEEKKSPQEEKKTIGPSDSLNGKKLGPFSTEVDQALDHKFLLELEKRVQNDSGAREIKNVDKISFTDHSSKSTGKVLESNTGILVEGHQKFMPKGGESRMPNGERLEIEAMPVENGFVCHIMEKNPKKVEGGFWQVEKASENQKGQKDRNKHKKNDGKADKQKDGHGEKKSKSKDKKGEKEKKEKKMKDDSTPGQNKLRDGSSNAVDTETHGGLNFPKQSNGKNRDLAKRKEPEMNGFFHGAEISLNKLCGPLSFAEVTQNGRSIDASNGGLQFASERDAAVQKHKLNGKVSSSNSGVENESSLDKGQIANNFELRKQEVTGNRHKASNSLPSSKSTLGIGRKLEPCQAVISFASMDQGELSNHTLDKKVSSAQLVTENGAKSPFSQSSYLSSSEGRGTVYKPKLDRESRSNGVVGLKKPKEKSLRPAAPRQLEEAVETHIKSLHPDSKYLSEILSVPKVEWRDVDEQAWLFTCEDHQIKKPKIDSTSEETKQVWAEALWVESADVTALPYVIPY